MLSIPVWYIPSFYGDVRLYRVGNDVCLLVMEALSAAETVAVDSVEAIGIKKGWFGDVRLTAGKLSSPLHERGKMKIAAPMEKVSRVLAKALKPGRKLVEMVKFFNGQVLEMVEATYDNSKSETAKADAVAAATVARPSLGCPEPDFAKADIRATEVLNAFLSDEQREDFQKYNRFITAGVSGHRYMVTSRYARDQLAMYHRSLYDLDEDKPLCVHDESVAAAEEMLALHLLVQLPGHEDYLRRLETA